MKLLATLRGWLKELEQVYVAECEVESMLLIVRLPCGCWRTVGPEDLQKRMLLVGDYICYCCSDEEDDDHSHDAEPEDGCYEEDEGVLPPKNLLH